MLTGSTTAHWNVETFCDGKILIVIPIVSYKRKISKMMPDCLYFPPLPLLISGALITSFAHTMHFEPHVYASLKRH